VIVIGGLALFLGAGAYAAAWIGFVVLGRDPGARHWLPLHLLVVAGSIGIAAGLPALHARQEPEAGAIGLAATAMLFVGILLAGVARQSVEAFALRVIPRVPPGADLLVRVAGPLLFAGTVTLGIVTVVAGVFPTWTGAALVTVAIAGAIAANARVPGRFSYANAAVMGLILAYLGLLVVFGARA
jgi:hypothetical protein